MEEKQNSITRLKDETWRRYIEERNILGFTNDEFIRYLLNISNEQPEIKYIPKKSDKLRGMKDGR